MVLRDLGPAEAEDRLMVSLPVKTVRKLLNAIDADRSTLVERGDDE